MQDRELVAAIVAGDPDALAEAYDRYAASLYTYCRFMLPDPHPPGAAADAVADTFIVATVRLAGLRDPDQLGSWLRAAARNECLRQLEPAGAAAPAPDDAMPEVSLPAGLRERVLEACSDNTPTGRAHRVSVTHRAGPFGVAGFPKPIIPPGPRWWHEVRRHPRAAAGVAAVAVTVVAAGVATVLIAGGTHQAHVSAVALGGGSFGTSSAVSNPAGGQSSPSRKPTPASGAPTPAADGPTAGASTPWSSAPAPSSSPSRSPSPSQSPSPSPSPSPGTLRVIPTEVVLSAVTGKPARATFTLTAVGGPVNFVINSPNGKVTVSPPSGSLSSDGSSMTIIVTVRSLVSFNTHLTVEPGDLIITVLFTIKP